MDDLFRFGLNNAAWAATLAIVAVVGSRVWRKRPALAHALWLLVLLKLATPSVLQVSAPWSDTEERVRHEAARMGLGARRIPTVGIVPARVAPLVYASLFSPPRLLLPQELWGASTRRRKMPC